MKDKVLPWIQKERNKKQTVKTKDGYYKDRERFQRFYQSSAWQRMRLYILALNPFCSVCKKEIATEVDHIIPLSVDYALRLDADNLQGLCGDCHKRKTARDTVDKRNKEREEQIDINMSELNDI